MIPKVNLENMQAMYHFGLKILCDGYVTEWRFKIITH